MKIALIGYGKMGHEIENIAISRGHSINLIIDRDNMNDLSKENLSEIDVAIEFSTPDAAYANIMKCLELGVPVVCGTTAWIDKLNHVKKYCGEVDGAFFYASNYSIGVNLTFRINQMLAEMMNKFTSYDVSLEEVHHTTKIDAPSGTAVTLAGDIIEAIDRKKHWILGASTAPHEMNVTAIRRGTAPGTHTVVWDSPVDEITLSHRAKGRVGFAEGAVVAAEFLVGKKGVYGMNDLLK